MKNFWLLGTLMCGLTFIFVSCDDTFCIEEYTYEETAIPSTEVNFTLPTGESYTGQGRKINFELGDYDMTMIAYTISLVVIENGADLHTIHYFYDGDGNSFWSEDNFTLTSTGELGKATADYTLNIMDGRGDFECPSGPLSIDLFTNTIDDVIDVKLYGKICGGCE